jgi:type IV secretion system protein VirB4
MWNLGEYRNRPQRLSDYLPWACLIGPGVVLNKDGAFQKTVRFRGPDLDSSGGHELVSVRARLNNVLRRLGSHWCVHVEASRRQALDYPAGTFPHGVAALVDEERRRAFGTGGHFESRYYLTLAYLPPPEEMNRLADLFLERPAPSRAAARGGVDYGRHLEYFLGQVEQLVNLLGGFMPEVHPLDDGETLTYLHGCVSDRALLVEPPGVPFFLDELLTDAPVVGGLAPRLGSLYLKTVGVRTYANRTLPCLLDRLNELPMEYRWVGRYLPMDKVEAARSLNKLRRHWFAKRKNLWTLLREVLTKQESALEDTDSLNKAEDVDAALQELGADFCSFGDFTLTVTTWDAQEAIAMEKARAIQQVIDGFGIVSEIEDFNALQAWLGSLPGHAYANVRRPVVSSLNVCDLVPLSAVWSGPEENRHLNGPPLLVTRTKGSTPFRLSLHQGDVGHTIVAGPTGAGKSTLLSLLACQFLRYKNAQVFFFDKGGSARAMTLALGGDFYDIGGEGEQGHTGICFQPLALSGHADREGQEADLGWAQDWVVDLIGREGVGLTPAIKRELWAALVNLASMPRRQRTLSTLTGLVQDQPVRDALRTYTLAGAHGDLLDADHDTLASHRGMGDMGGHGVRWQVFEMEHLMARGRNAVLPVLTYLFHRLDRHFDGRPTLLVLDEAWLYLTESLFAAKIREWLKVLRKRNVAVVFATQSLSDIADSAVAPAVVENCLTRIFLPNAMAMEERARRVYESFGLSEKQLEILQGAIPKREYYYQSREGNRLFELGLGDLQLALCGASGPGDHARMNRLLASHGPRGFAEAYLRECGLAPPVESADETVPLNDVDDRIERSTHAHDEHISAA